MPISKMGIILTYLRGVFVKEVESAVYKELPNFSSLERFQGKDDFVAKTLDCGSYWLSVFSLPQTSCVMLGK